MTACLRLACRLAYHALGLVALLAVASHLAL